jgi:hypothetical protein
MYVGTNPKIYQLSNLLSFMNQHVVFYMDYVVAIDIKYSSQFKRLLFVF